jgi:UDP-N-acetylglucosamine diphosphorylase/glucosamine-1-phosphate N-acetyltransferase
MKITLFDDIKRKHLLPLVFTRPCADLRIGILTIEQKWQELAGAETDFSTEEYLSTKFPRRNSDSVEVNGRIIPNSGLVDAISSLTGGSLVDQNGETIARIDDSESTMTYEGEVNWVNRPFDLFAKAGEQIKADFDLLTASRKSEPIPESVNIVGDGDIFIEEGAILNFCSLNTTGGPIYIGKNSELMEGSLIRGPFALGEHSVVKMGAKIYGATSIGPHCKVGGEVNNCTILGYSNKGHDGFLGNSVIGEWCNIGADSNNSNLKNNYDDVKLWDYTSGRFERTGLQFCGLVMGDHSKCGINTMFNTGTVIGVSANIFGSGFPRNFVPSFSWGGNAGVSTYMIKKALDTAGRVMIRRGIELDETESSILTEIFNLTTEYRN